MLLPLLLKSQTRLLALLMNSVKLPLECLANALKTQLAFLLNSRRVPLALLADYLRLLALLAISPKIPLDLVNSPKIPLVNFLRILVLVLENLLQILLSFPLLEILKEPSIDRFAVLNEPVVLGILEFLSKGL